MTIISAESWTAMMRELGADSAPSARRANVMVSGMALAGTRGGVFGEVLHGGVVVTGNPVGWEPG